MKILRKVAAGVVLVAIAAGASAGEATVEEIVVVGQRPFETLPRIEAQAPVAQPALEIAPFAPVITLPAIELVGR